MVMHFSGRIADSFDREFRCLYADSQIIDCFCNPEEEGMPHYPAYQGMMAPHMGLNLVSDRYSLFTFSNLCVLISCVFSERVPFLKIIWSIKCQKLVKNAGLPDPKLLKHVDQLAL